jgi:aryl-alcohol dehydrogenase-like predicted oxidoreductase
VGFRDPGQVDEIVGAASIELDAAEVAELESGRP